MAPIIGIGASAGGLEALTDFLSNVLPDCGMAFVVVQHLDPTHKGMLPELLQRATRMPVVQAKDRMQVQANSVYVIPPNKDMSILHGRLHLLDPISPRGLRLPIDFFLRALADDCGACAAGVILSGMGSDGTLGLRAIKEKSGLVLVQDPADAKFDSMPNSAINAGVVDIVAPTVELPAKIAAYFQHYHHGGDVEPLLAPKAHSALEKIVLLLRERSGNDFSLYKSNTVHRRIERRMGLHQIDSIDNYVRYLRENPQEVGMLFKELLIGVTNFFRDPPAWEYLSKVAIPAMLARYPGGKKIRAWVPACSTGEEAYSLAISFREAFDQIKPSGLFTLQIFATDLDEDAIDQARQGAYPTNIEADVSAERLARFFVADEQGYRVSKEIREMVTFAPHNILTDPPFTKLDVLTCRNLLIYFGAELQKKLFPLFHYTLNAQGILFLGTAETIGSFTDLFAPLDSKLRIYQRMDNHHATREIEFPTKIILNGSNFVKKTLMETSPLNLQQLVDQYLLHNCTPTAVLVNADGDILYISGSTGKYFEPAVGKANWNLHAMARDGLRHALSDAMHKAQQQKEAVTLEGLRVAGDDGSASVNVTVKMIEKPEALRGKLMLTFTDVATPVVEPSPRKNAAKGATEDAPQKALQQAREEMQRIREEKQTALEELKSSNEELQSINEEMQSTNEELTTSKEEMQSLNEELQSVNAELLSKVDDLSGVNNDMKNLLDSTEIATVFLDNDLNVRRFTSHATKIFKLIPHDVGRPLSDIVNDLDYKNFQQDVQEVLRTLVFSEKSIATHDGRWYKVRIMPYRTQNNVIDGVVITLSDITVAKVLEEELRKNSIKLPDIGIKKGRHE